MAQRMTSLTVDEYRAELARRMPERELLAEVVKLAHRHGWLVYHTWRSDHSAGGFPDLVLVRPPRIVIVELKAEQGNLRPQQREWLAGLQACPGVETYLWRPSDWEDVKEVLR